MIVDRIENLEKYFALNPLFKEVADFLSANDMSALSTGIHHIKGDDVFVNIQEAAGKTKEQAVVEYHRKMVDIQIPFSLPMLPCFARPSSRSKHRQIGGYSISFTLFT